MTYLYIFLGGGLGAIARYLTSQIITLSTISAFPFGTLTVNAIGSLFIGVVFQLTQKHIIPSELSFLITIGFLGGFTTFSTFSLEAMTLFKSQEYRFLITHILLNNLLAFTFTGVGLYLGSLIKLK